MIDGNHMIDLGVPKACGIIMDERGLPTTDIVGLDWKPSEEFLDSILSNRGED
jgi:hypothetical protein